MSGQKSQVEGDKPWETTIVVGAITLPDGTLLAKTEQVTIMVSSSVSRQVESAAALTIANQS